MLRVVLDSNVIVSASLTANGSPSRIVQLALMGSFLLYLSRDVFAEYSEVLARPKFSHHLARAQALLDGIKDVAEWVEPNQLLTISSDEEDNRLLECAQAAQANFLVTGNRKHFPDRFGDIVILAPRDFLEQCKKVL